MNLKFEVKRHRLSLTQGEAEVLVNGKTVVQYSDKIELQDGQWKSVHDDAHFIEAAMRQYSDKIIKLFQN